MRSLPASFTALFLTVIPHKITLSQFNYRSLFGHPAPEHVQQNRQLTLRHLAVGGRLAPLLHHLAHMGDDGQKMCADFLLSQSRTANIVRQAHKHPAAFRRHRLREIVAA